MAGGTRVRFVGTNFGGRRLRCRFGWYEVDATYVDMQHVLCDSPHVRQPHSAEVQVAADGETYTTEALMFSFYLTAGMVSSVWPLGGPTAGGTHLTVRGAGFNNFDGLAIVLGSGPPLRTWLLSSTAVVATSSNASSAWLSPSSVSPVGGTPIILPFGGDGGMGPLMSDGRVTRPVGGFSDGGMGPAAPGGETVRVTLNGDLRQGEQLHGGAQFRYYDPKLLAVSEVFPLGAHHNGGEVVTLHGSGFLALGAPRCAFGNVRTARGATQPRRKWEGGDEGGDLVGDEVGDVPREKWGWFPRDPGVVDPSLPEPLHMDDLLHVAALCGEDARYCKASPELLMPATILGPNEARCKAPSVDIWPAAPQLLELTLNGDAAAKTADNHTFAIFGQPGFEVVISSVRPQGAPTAGGTLVELRGTGDIAPHNAAALRLSGGLPARVPAVAACTPAVHACVYMRIRMRPRPLRAGRRARALWRVWLGTGAQLQRRRAQHARAIAAGGKAGTALAPRVACARAQRRRFSREPRALHILQRWRLGGLARGAAGWAGHGRHPRDVARRRLLGAAGGDPQLGSSRRELGAGDVLSLWRRLGACDDPLDRLGE